MPGLIDTHTHLESFIRAGKLTEILAEASRAGVERMITVGTEPDDWALYREAASQHPERIAYTVGLHPCSVTAEWESQVAGMEAYFSSGRPVAVGETGLDRFHLPKDAAAAQELFAHQQASFRFHLEFAGRVGCPVVIHSRHAFRECVELIDAAGFDWRRVVFHCFAEGVAEMEQLLSRGGRGSFTGIITYPKAESVREAARVQGLEQLMLETDAPYLAPVPERGRPNQPAFLRHTAQYCAEWFGVPLEELAHTTGMQARRFYGL